MKGKHHGGEAIAEINNQADKSPRWGSPSSSRVSWGRPSPEVIGRESRSASSGMTAAITGTLEMQGTSLPRIPLIPFKVPHTGQLIDALNGETSLGSPKPYFPHPDEALCGMRASGETRGVHASMLLYFHAFVVS